MSRIKDRRWNFELPSLILDRLNIECREHMRKVIEQCRHGEVYPRAGAAITALVSLVVGRSTNKSFLPTTEAKAESSRIRFGWVSLDSFVTLWDELLRVMVGIRIM